MKQNHIINSILATSLLFGVPGSCDSNNLSNTPMSISTLSEDLADSEVFYSWILNGDKNSVPLSIEFALENFYRAEPNSKVKRVQVPVFYLQVTSEALGSGYLDFQPYVYYAGSTPSLESAPGVSEFDIGKMDGAVTILILSSQGCLRNDPEMESLIQTRSIIPLYIDLNQIKSGGEGLALDLISSDWTGGNSTLHSFRLAFGDVTQLEDPNDTYKYQNVGSLEALESLLDQQN